MKHGGGSSATVSSASKDAPKLSVVELPAHREEVDSKLEQTREYLLSLRRQQEELERQRGELEELRRKQEEYSRGRAEMIDQLTRSLVTLERQQIESQRLAELCAKTGDAFRDYLERIQEVSDQDWNSDNVREELSKALGVIENARLEYNRAVTKLDCLNPAAGTVLPPENASKKTLSWDEFLRYAYIGAAASAPLIIAGTIWLIVLVATKH